MSRPWFRFACTPVAFLLLALAAPPGFGALAQRTFVSGTPIANDANPCSLALPCRSFGAAIAQTIPAGEVIVLDSAGYGPVTITQSVSIIAPAGVYAGISVISPTNTIGVNVNAAGIKVLLQNLVINGLGGSFGVQLTQGAELYVNNCTIANFTFAGIYSIAAGSKLYVKDTVVRDNVGPGGFGVWLAAGATADLERVRAASNGSDGIRVELGAAATVKRSVMAKNASAGIGLVSLAGQTARATIEDSLVSDNAGNGISLQASGAGAVIEMSAVRNTITRNNFGVFGSGTAPATSTGNIVGNLIAQNAQDGVFATGSGVTMLASNNTFSGNLTHALNTGAGGTIHTVKGADGLPNNSGEQATPTGGTVTAVAPF